MNHLNSIVIEGRVTETKEVSLQDKSFMSFHIRTRRDGKYNSFSCRVDFPSGIKTVSVAKELCVNVRIVGHLMQVQEAFCIVVEHVERQLTKGEKEKEAQNVQCTIWR